MNVNNKSSVSNTSEIRILVIKISLIKINRQDYRLKSTESCL